MPAQFALKSSGQVTGDGIIGAGTIRVYALIVTPAAADARVDLKLDSGAGSILLTGKAVANGPSVVIPIPEGGLVFASVCFADISGVGAEANILYDD